VFKEQIEIFKEFMINATPDKEQQKDIGFLLSVGELFTLVAYGQLLIENANIKNLDDDILDTIFDVLVCDFSKYALELNHNKSSSEKQMEIFMRMVKKPVLDMDNYNRVWEKHVIAQKDVYEMNQ
jgi:acyl-CoA dehydrogenase